MRRICTALAAPLILLACSPGWGVVVENHSGETRYLRYIDAGSPLVFEIEPGVRGLLGIGNAPGPSAVDVLDYSCVYIETVRVAREGGTWITLTESALDATPTTLPQEIPERQLESSDLCQDAPAGS
jgi:hypothetical protein